MQEFDFTVIHHWGKKHLNADAMSRRPEHQDQPQTSDTSSHPTEPLSPSPVPSDQSESTATQLNQQTVSATMIAIQPSSETNNAFLRNTQLEDDTTGPILRAREVDRKPDTESLRRHSRAVCQLFSFGTN